MVLKGNYGFEANMFASLQGEFQNFLLYFVLNFDFLTVIKIKILRYN